MAHPASLRAFVAQLLQDKGLPSNALVWKWKAQQPGVDYALALHAARLDAAQEAAMTSAILSHMPALEAVFFEHGFLNIRFSTANWVALWQYWCEQPNAFLEAAMIPEEIGQEPILWRYRLLKVLQEAAVLARIEGWLPADLYTYVPTETEIGWLKSLLSLGGVLHQKAELPQKRLAMMTQIQEMMAQMWVQPILTPVDPHGSAFRQGILRLAMTAAETIGSPSTQSLEGSISLHFEKPKKIVE